MQLNRGIRGARISALVLGLVALLTSSSSLAQQNGTWTTRAAMPTPRHGVAVGLINGIVYVVGGFNNGALAINEAYNPTTDTWTTGLASMPTPRSGSVSTNGVSVNGLLYAIGGNSSGFCSSANEAYNPATNTWSIFAPMPTPRCYLAVVALNGLIYAIGGTNTSGSVFYPNVEVYNPSSDTWATAAPLPTARDLLTAAVVNGFIYAIGGSDSGGGCLATVEAFNPTTNVWTAEMPLPAPTCALGAAALNGLIYAVGGANETGYLATSQAYNPTTNTWVAVASMPTARADLGVLVVNGVIYAIGGSNGTELSSNQVFAPAQIPPTPHSRIVSGTEIVTYSTGPLPVDLSTTTVTALVPNGVGGYNTLTGTGASDGTFSIPDVPHGFYLLQIGNSYLWTHRSFVDLNTSTETRPNIVQANPSTTFTFDVTNLNPWQDTDSLELVDPNNSSFEFYSPVVGATTLTGTFPYNEIPNNVGLFDASQGDQAYIIQEITQFVSGLQFNACGRILIPPPFTQVNGGDTAISGTFTTVPQNQTFRANINGADLAAQALAANPKAVFLDVNIDLQAHPGSLASAFPVDSSTIDLLLGGTPATNGDFGDVFYGNPFPSSTFPLFVTYGADATTNYLAPGATQSRKLQSRVSVQTPTLPTATTPLQPLVGAVISPFINGLDLFQDQIGVGVTPTLTWSPPSLGTATYYTINVFRLSNNTGKTSITRMKDRLQTQQTSITIPPGLLSAGQASVFLVRANFLVGGGIARAPFARGRVFAFADTLSGVILP